MQTLTLCENDITTLRRALEIARKTYRKNAAQLRTIPGHDRLAQQFDRQAEDAGKLIKAFDE